MSRSTVLWVTLLLPAGLVGGNGSPPPGYGGYVEGEYLRIGAPLAAGPGRSSGRSAT